MTTSSYPAARVAAKRMEEHLAARISVQPDSGHMGLPEAGAIEQIISAAFWASLRQDEGRVPKISLALLPPDRTVHPLIFDPWISLAPDALARLAPAVERPGIHLGVWWQDGNLVVWGTTRTVPMYCFVLEVVAPGLLVAKYRRGDESAKFANFAVLEGADVKFIDQRGPVIPESMLAFCSSAHRDSESILVQLAVSIRAHGHGGSLLVVPKDSDEWRESIIRPLTYSIAPPFSEISDLLQKQAPAAALHSAVTALAGFTAVDGATIISDDLDLLAFGAKITRRDGAQRVQQVVLVEPFEGALRLEVEPTQFGGTRHLSAAQFVHDQRASIALVASQDGRFTVFTWSDPEQAVHAHRIEALLI